MNEQKNSGGRPTKYKKEFNKIVYQMGLLGATDAQIAEALNISRDTLFEWKEKHPKFSDTVRRSKTLADAQVAEGLFKRAVGFKYDEITWERIEQQTEGVVTPGESIKSDPYKKKVVTKHVIPDPGAAMNWLKNRQKDLWRDKSPDLDFEKLSEDQLDQIINRLKRSL